MDNKDVKTIYVGIDSGQDTFVAAAKATASECVFEPEAFENTIDGYDDFIRALAVSGIDAAAALICIENTGVYSEPICYAMHHAGFKIVLLDPGKIKRASPEFAPKTDAADSLKIATYAIRYQDRLVEWQPRAELVEQVDTLLSTREQLVAQRTASKNALYRLKKKVVKTPKANRAMENTIDHLSKQIKELEAEIRKLTHTEGGPGQMMALVASIPGVGLLLSAHLFVMTNAFEKELSYTTTAQYLGIAPNPYQSGTSVYMTPRSRGFGPSTMRKLLHLAARSIATHNPVYNLYYRRKLAEGKPPSLVLNNIANKLLRLVCAVVRSQTPFIPTYRSPIPVSFVLTKS